MVWSRAFQKFANLFADSKSIVKELSNNVAFVIRGQQTSVKEGGGEGQIYPPPPGLNRIKKKYIFRIYI